MTRADQDQQRIAEQEMLIEKIRPILAGHRPEVQGAALAELLALFLAGHAPIMRDEIIELHVSAVLALVPLAEHEIFGDGPRPKGWE